MIIKALFHYSIHLWIHLSFKILLTESVSAKFYLLTFCDGSSIIVIHNIGQTPSVLFNAQDKHLPQCSIHGSSDDGRINDINVNSKPSTIHTKTPTNRHIS
jgi:hypothetical protein